MPLKQKDIEELKRSYYRDTGDHMGDAEAWDMGIRLLSLYRTTVGLPPDERVRTSSNLPKTPID